MLPTTRVPEKVLRSQSYISASQELTSWAATQGPPTTPRPVRTLLLASPKIGGLPQLPWKKKNTVSLDNFLITLKPNKRLALRKQPRFGWRPGLGIKNKCYGKLK